jgi:hypothetical protein
MSQFRSLSPQIQSFRPVLGAAEGIEEALAEQKSAATVALRSRSLRPLKRFTPRCLAKQPRLSRSISAARTSNDVSASPSPHAIARARGSSRRSLITSSTRFCVTASPGGKSEASQHASGCVHSRAISTPNATLLP